MSGVTSSRLRILHANIQGLKEKTLELESVLREEHVDVFCVNEHWLLEDEFWALTIPGFRTASGFCRSERIRGGVGIYVRDGIGFRSMKLEGSSTEVQCEVSGIFLNEFNLQVISMYRSPSGVFDAFAGALSRILDGLDTSKQTVIAGDFNVHFENDRDRDALELCNLFRSYAFSGLVGFSTRLNACLDNVFADCLLPSPSVERYSLRQQCLSDHDGVVLTVSVPSNSLRCKKRINYRPITDIGLFKLYSMVELVNWNFISDPGIDVDGKFGLFIDVVRETVDKCFPVKSKLVDMHSGVSHSIQWYGSKLRDMRERLRLLTSMHYDDPVRMPRDILLKYRHKYRQELISAKKGLMSASLVGQIIHSQPCGK